MPGFAVNWFEKQVYIPNKEISHEFLNAAAVIGWNELMLAISDSERLLNSLWNEDEAAVASGIEKFP